MLVVVVKEEDALCIVHPPPPPPGGGALGRLLRIKSTQVHKVDKKKCLAHLFLTLSLSQLSSSFLTPPLSLSSLSPLCLSLSSLRSLSS